LKLNAAGNDLIYSTFIGGEDNDNANSMALDSTGHVVVTGDTNSDDFPTTLGSIETTDNEYENIFVLKLNEVGLIYSTLIGGSDDDEAESLALDSAGNAVVMGVTYSDDFPTTAGSYDTTHNGEYDKDTFVLRLDGLDSEEGANFSISGRVTYSSGRGIEGLTLSAGSGSATTNRNGDYITTHLPSGEYTLTPEKAGYTFDPESRSVSIQGAHVTDQDFIAIRLPSLTINHSVGAPGSSFTIRGRNYPANTSVSIAINRQNLGTVQVNQSGGLTFLLTTPNADVGAYGVTASASTQMRAGISFMLDSAAPLQPQEGEGETFEVPADIAYTQLLYLPIVIR
ncbi:MAG: SBBP repeat-containing protein, partial [Ardenticatenaceae bacterium]